MLAWKDKSEKLITEWLSTHLTEFTAKLKGQVSEINSRVDAQVGKVDKQLEKRLTEMTVKLEAQLGEQAKAARRLEDLLLNVKKILDASELGARDSLGMFSFGEQVYWFYDTVSSLTTGAVVSDIIGANYSRKVEHPYFLEELSFDAGDTVIDIGANIGVFSVFAAKRFPGLKVIAVEPSGRNCENLRKNAEINGVADRITIEHAAVTKDGRSIDLVYVPGKPRDAFMADVTSSLKLSKKKKDMVSRAYAVERETVRSMTLDELFTKHNLNRLSMLKIDCEGAEDEILRNTTSLGKIDRVCGEMHYGEAKDLELLAYLATYIDRTKLRFGRPGHPSVYA